MPTLVLGHVNPDTDTTCSAIAYASFLKAEPVVAGPLNKETAHVLQRFSVQVPRQISSLTAEDSVVIVDTNNPEELLPGIDQAELLEIVDHHKLVGGLHTASPLKVTMRPVACTCTILLDLMGEPSKEVAGLMLAAILSDTLKFTSPTTTDADRDAAARLAQIAGVSVDDLAEGMFAAKSDLTGMSTADILTVDSKVFPMGEKKVRVSVLETTAPAAALSIRGELEEAMRQIKVSEGLDAAFFFVVDIIASAATLLVPSDYERGVAGKAFGVEFSGETADLPGIVSRKKQMVPKLEEALTA